MDGCCAVPSSLAGLCVFTGDYVDWDQFWVPNARRFTLSVNPNISSLHLGDVLLTGFSCGLPCLSCFTPNNCTECDRSQGYFVFSGRCVLSCPAETHADFALSACLCSNQLRRYLDTVQEECVATPPGGFYCDQRFYCYRMPFPSSSGLFVCGCVVGVICCFSFLVDSSLFRSCVVFM